MSLIKSNHGGLGGSGAPGGALGSFYSHTIDQSLRCNGSNEYLTRTPSSSGNRRTWTYSAWVKLGVDGVRFTPIEAYSNGTNFDMFNIHTDGRILFYTVTSAIDYGGLTTQRLRDPSAWYHIVFRFDSTQSTAADRIRIYINGTQQEITNPFTTDYGTLPQNYDSFINHTVPNHIMKNTNSSQYGQGYIAEVHHIDGTSYAPETFAERIDGIWVPKEVSGVSYGTNGFHLNFADSSDIGNNANSTDGTNDWTVNNFTASDIVSDSPTRNFATLMPMTNIGLSEGNLKMTTTRTGNWDGTIGSFGVTSGKWYYEVRMSATEGTFRCVAGWQGNQASQTVTYNGKGASGSPYGTLFDNYLVNVFTTSFYKDGGTDGTMTAASSGDVINVAADFDNGKIYFGINGTYYANDGGTDGNPGAGTNESMSGIDLTAQEYVPAFHIRSDNSTGGNQMIVNFGQEGTFADTETAGGNSDANGVGNFFNAVPSGFLALCSSNLPDPTIGPGQDTIALDNFETMIYTGNDTEQHIGSGGARHPQDTVTIAKSLRFEDSSLHRDITSSGNTRTWTWSAWVKRSSLGGSNGQYLFQDGAASGFTSLNFDSSDRLYAQLRDTTAGASKYKLTNREFKDVSTWYHIVWRVDTTQSTDADRSRLYINGTQITDWNTEEHVASANNETSINAAGTDHLIGAYKTSATARHFGGYMAEINFIDGQSYGPELFGQVGSNGYWIPKSLSGVSYGSGNNSFRLDFADSSALGDDESGNGNDFDITDNVSAIDQSIDSPTQNFATLDPNEFGVVTFSSTGLTEGNTAVTTPSSFSSSLWGGGFSTFEIPFGSKVYAEFRANATGVNWLAGACLRSATPSSTNVGGANSVTFYNRAVYKNGTQFQYHTNDGIGGLGGGNSPLATGDILGVAVDGSTGEVWFSKNGTYFKPIRTNNTSGTIGSSSGNPSTGTDASGVVDRKEDPREPLLFIVSGATSTVINANFGTIPHFNDDSFTAGTESDDNSVGLFKYNPPTGFLALVDDNIPQTGIKSPDWVWIKQRNGNSHSHYLFDSVRGAGKDLHSDVGNAEATDHDTLKSFDNQGFTVGADTYVNDGADTYVAWTWKAGGAPTVDNSAAANATPTAGSVKIDGANKTDAFSGSPDLAVTRLSANTTAGFSIVAYEGSSSNPKTVPHGLTQALDAIIVKNRDGGDSWAVGHVGHGFNNSSNLRLEESSQASSGANGFSSDPDANVFTVGSEPVVNSASSYIAYCFHSVPGYSKFGSYEGIANADGAFVFTGFRPAWVMIKNTSTSGSWIIFDSTREGGASNVINDHLMADTHADEGVDDDMDFLSNGFKCRRSSTSFNSDHTFIYFAFAEAPFKFANAR